MTIQSSDSGSLETRNPLDLNPNTGFVSDFSDRYTQEPEDISRAVGCMVENIMSGHVTKWAQRGDLIGQTAGFSSTLTDAQKAHEISQIAQKTYDNAEDVLGGLRLFDAVENDDYLDGISGETVNPTAIDSAVTDYEVDRLDRIAAATELVNAMYPDVNLQPEVVEDISQLDDSNFAVA